MKRRKKRDNMKFKPKKVIVDKVIGYPFIDSECMCN